MDAARLRATLLPQGIVLPPGDPLLELGPIVEAALKDTRQEIAAALDAALLRIDQAGERNVAAAKKVAEGIVNAAGDWAAGRIREAGETVAAEMTAQIQREQAALARTAHRAILAAYVCAGCTVATVGSLVAFLALH